MGNMLQMVRQRVFTLLLAMLATGFALLLVELLITNHTEGLQMVGVIANALGLILTAAALLVGGRPALIIAGLLMVLSLTGLLGTYQHYVYGPGEIARGEEEDERESIPSPLAPLSIAGLSVMTATVIVARTGEGQKAR